MRPDLLVGRRRHRHALDAGFRRALADELRCPALEPLLELRHLLVHLAEERLIARRSFVGEGHVSTLQPRLAWA